ncbi:structural maintenance of chromosomes protein 5 [Periplaneta americana]|uniref:structural maintenance of chromosomes protein 5 n=1 Tax=Periplaneta americana TaxID=6978 RepID=UPI0037E99317
MDGSIVRIFLEDFITYKKVVFEPNSHLNVIIGPNGTGKSTLVCAMVLGLGGKPKVLGRATNINSYIRANCKIAKVEIELKNTSGPNYIVTRILTDDGKSSWQLNGQSATQKQVDELIMKLNIQVDNLCQFLPQDRVADFSKMNSQQRLESTMKCVGSPEMTEYHVQLKDLCKRLAEFDRHITITQQKLQNEEQRNDRIQVTVGNISEKKTLLKLVELLKQKRAWMLFNIARRKSNEMKIDKEGAMKALAEHKKRYAPMEKKVSAAKEKVTDIEKKIFKKNSEKSKKYTAIREVQECIEKIEDSIKENTRERDRKIQSEEKRRNEVNALLQQISKLQNDLQNASEESVDMIQEELEKLRIEMNHKAAATMALRQERENLQTGLESVVLDVRAKENEKQKIEDVGNQRLEILRRRRNHVYEAVMWFRRNKDNFRYNIFEPMMLEINVTVAGNAKYVENVVSSRDLVAFTCEDKDDMNKLLTVLRDEQHLKINAVHSGPEHPSTSTYKPYIPIGDLRQYGFHSYLREMISAPEPIMKYLCRMYKIYNIPVGDASTYAHCERIPLKMSYFFTENHSFRVSVSKYSGERSTRTSEIPPPFYLAITLDAERLQELQAKLEAQNEEKARIMNRLDFIQRQLHHEERLIEECRQKRKTWIECRDHKRTVSARLNSKQMQLNGLENEKIDTDAEKAKCKRNNQALILELQDIHGRMAEAMRQFSDCVIECNILQEELENTRNIAAVIENESRELSRKCEETQQLVQRIGQQFQEAKAEAFRLYNEAEKMTGGLNPKDEGFGEFVKSWDLLPEEEEELDKEIQDTQAKADCLGDADEMVMQEYEKRKTHIASLQNTIYMKEEEREKLKTDILDIRNKWLPPLKELVAQISQKYGECFSHIGCAGEVLLDCGSNEDDYEHYGLKIKVKYRDGEQMQELTQHLQSGGERAVATAIYMISLQELTHVPFCCVDEINQGMDAVNERMIFELLVATTRNAGTAQYFLLTPKLLPSLLYEPTMKVHCIFNGCGALSCDNWDLEKMIERKIALDKKIAKKF